MPVAPVTSIRYGYVFSGAGSIWGNTGCYLVVQYKFLLLGIRWNWVITRLLCVVCILKQVEIWSDVTIAGRKNKQGKTQLLSQWTMDGWDEHKRGHSL